MERENLTLRSKFFFNSSEFLKLQSGLLQQSWLFLCHVYLCHVIVETDEWHHRRFHFLSRTDFAGYICTARIVRVWFPDNFSYNCRAGGKGIVILHNTNDKSCMPIAPLTTLELLSHSSAFLRSSPCCASVSGATLESSTLRLRDEHVACWTTAGTRVPWAVSLLY